MNNRIVMAVGIGTVATAIALSGCSSSGTSSPTSSRSSAGSAVGAASPLAGGVLPVASNPIVNKATAPTLTITKAAVEDNVDPATGKAIGDRLQLTLKNTGTTPISGFEVYYEMTDVVTKAKESYYQKLDGLTIPAGQEATVYFDNMTDPGHYPENKFSIYRNSNNQVDFRVWVSATGAKIATATATKATGTGEKVD